MTQVIVTTEAYKLTVEAPYDPTFPTRAHQLGGRWDATTKTWRFDLRDEQAVRALVTDIYGSDGSQPAEPVCTVRVPVAAAGSRKDDAEFRVAGRRLVWRPGRDEAVRYADGVVLIAGGFPTWGGSMRYPELNPDDGTMIEIRDLPLGTAEKIVVEVRGATIVDAADKVREALLDERGRLLARLAEIDALLGGTA